MRKNLLRCLLGLFIVASPSLANASPIGNFASATCTLKASIGTTSNKKAIVYMMQGITMADPKALNAWRANTGGNTYYGNVDAGRNTVEFVNWIKTQNYSSAALSKILLDAVNKKCKGNAGDSSIN